MTSALTATNNPSMLVGLEEDVVEMTDDNKEPRRRNDDDNETPQDQANVNQDQTSPLSQRELLLNNQAKFESVPTDKFYLEMEKKFAIQNKNLFEKRQEERMRQLADAEQKRKLKEELKFQISTPQTALKTHKFIRTVFLLIQGINVGFLIWQAVVAYTLNLNAITLDLNSTSIPEQFPYFYLYADLAMPIHCLSYFFLTICIVDCMDR